MSTDDYLAQAEAAEHAASVIVARIDAAEGKLPFAEREQLRDEAHELRFQARLRRRLANGENVHPSLLSDIGAETPPSLSIVAEPVHLGNAPQPPLSPPSTPTAAGESLIEQKDDVEVAVARILGSTAGPLPSEGNAVEATVARILASEGPALSDEDDEVAAVAKRIAAAEDDEDAELAAIAARIAEA